MKTIVVLDDYESAFAPLKDHPVIAQHADVRIHTQPLKGQDLVEAVKNADVLVLMRDRTPLTRSLIEHMPRLSLVTFTGTRNMALDKAALDERGISVCHTEWGPSKDSTAEWAWTLIMAAFKRLVENHSAMKAGQWRSAHSQVPVLHGERLGLIGLGEIGSRVARYAKAFGMEVVTWSPRMTEARAQEHGAQAVDLDTLLRTSRIVSLHLVPSADTKGLLNVERLSMMRTDGLLVNTSRSSLIQTADLIEAMKKGRPGQVALDVYDTEPLPTEDALRTLDDGLLLPHLGFISQPVIQTFVEQTIENLVSYLQTGAVMRRL